MADTAKILLFNPKHASDAFEVHQALVWLEARHPELKRNAYTPEGK